MAIFVLWDCFFAFQLYILKSNLKTAEDTEGVGLSLGYGIIAFQNGIMGNIENPSVEHWQVDGKSNFSATIIIYYLYIMWLANQFIMGIVLLNFVIA